MRLLRQARRQIAPGMLGGLLILPALWAHPALGADPSGQQAEQFIELDEVLVMGRKPINDAKKMSAWLGRLVGEFQYEGYVERPGNDGNAAERAEVHGSSQCSNIGAPGLVQCLMNVGWPRLPGSADGKLPDDAFYMAPAVAVYGIYIEPPPKPGRFPDPRYIGHMQVDGRGMAEYGIGELYDDTLIYNTPCADTPGNCQRVVQIEAPPGAGFVRVSVEVKRNSKLEVRHYFQWNRVPPGQGPPDNAALVVAGRTTGALMPADTAAWLRKLEGRFRFEFIADDRCLVSKLPCTTESVEQECLGIGDGPGVRCIRNMGWQEPRVPASRTMAAFDLWGYDAAVPKIVHANAMTRYTDNAGGLTITAGRLRGDTVTVTSPCDGKGTCSINMYTIPQNGQMVRQRARSPIHSVTIEAIRWVRIDSSSAEISPDAPRVRNPSPRRP